MGRAKGLERTDKAESQGKGAKCLWMGFRIDYRLVCLIGCRSRGWGGGDEKGQNDKAQKAQAGPRGGRHSRQGEAEGES